MWSLLITNACNLRYSERFKTVHLSPDRSPEQREAHKELIASTYMVAKALAEPDKKFNIKDGKIHSANRNECILFEWKLNK